MRNAKNNDFFNEISPIRSPDEVQRMANQVFQQPMPQPKRATCRLYRSQVIGKPFVQAAKPERPDLVGLVGGDLTIKQEGKVRGDLDNFHWDSSRNLKLRRI